jgi:hypothetical protein
MLTALYYPHTHVTNPIILKNALLLWDSLETIVPSAPRGSRVLAKNRLLQEAVDLVVRPRRPSGPERTEAHAVLEKMLTSGQLASLMVKAPAQWRSNRYLIYPDKFLGQTWRMLEMGGLARFEGRHADYGVPSALGFLMMSLLADTCAGTQIQKITDRLDAYSWLTEARASELGSTSVTGLDLSQVAPAYDRLVTLTLEVLDARAVPLKNLVAFRKREARSGSTDYSEMRRKYLAALDAHIAKVSKEAKTASDLRELERAFKNSIRHDLSDLKSELQLASKKALFSKEVALSAAITAGTLVSPIAGLTALASQVGLIGVIPLAKSIVELRGARRSALLKHTSSWLYLATKPRVTIH